MSYYPSISPSGIQRPGHCSYGPAQFAVPDGLVGYWGFDPDCYDFSGNVFDLSMYRANGAFTGTGGVAATSQIGGAYQFSSTWGQMQVPANTCFNNGDAQNFSVSFWAKPDSFTNYQLAVNQWIEATNNRQWGVGFFADAKAYFYTSTAGTSASTVSMASTSTFATTHFQHVVCTLDASGRTIYKDGIPDAFGATTTIFQAANPLTIGKPTNLFAGANSYYFGAIDDVRIYKRCLNASEVMILHMAGLQGRRDGWPSNSRMPMIPIPPLVVKQKHFRFRIDTDAVDAAPTWGAAEDVGQ